MNDKFSGKQVVAGCMIYMFFLMSVIKTMSLSFSLWPEFYGVSSAEVMQTMSISTGIGIIGSFFVGPVYKKFSPRKMMYVGALLALAMGLVTQVPDIRFLYIFMVIESLCATYCLNNCTTAICVRWYAKDSGSKIGLCSMANIVGGAVCMLVAGRIIPIIGIAKWWLYFGILCAAACVLSAIFLVKDSPESIGQKPYGYDPNEVAESKKSGKSKAGMMKILGTPVFWLVGIGIFVGGFCVILTSSYFTTFMKSTGMAIETVSAIYSLFLFAGGILAFFSGKIIDKIGVKSFVMIIFTAGILACIVCGYVSTTNAVPNVFFTILIVVFSAINHPMMMITVFLAVPIFGRDASDDALGLLAICMNGSSCVLNIVCSKVMGGYGFTVCYTVFGILTAIGMVCIMGGIIIGEKKIKER